MTARRLISVLTVALSAGAGVSLTVDAQPATKKPAKAKGKAAKKTPLAPAKDSGSGSGSGSSAGAGAGSAGAGSAVQMVEDPPPSDMTGTAENPDAPHSMLDSDNPPAVTAVVAPARPPGYPVEEALRPIALPQNLSEVSVVPHMQVSPYAASTALRVRYGVTPKVQLGLTYLIGAIFDDP